MLKRRVPLIECVLQIVKHGEPANFVVESYWCRVAECTEEAFAMIDHDVNVECYPAFAVGIDVLAFGGCRMEHITFEINLVVKIRLLTR